MNFKLKKYFIFIFCLGSLCAYAQEQGKTLIFGKILTADKNFDPFSYQGISYVVTFPNKDITIGHCKVDSLGRYAELFPHQTKVSLFTSYSEFYGDTISFETGRKEKIEESFYIRRKIYPYTAEKAKEDIKNGTLNIIIYDSINYELNKKYNYTKEFGFDYKYVHYDNDLISYIYDYNSVVEEMLDSKLDKNWYKKITIIEDSLINLELDNYMLRNPIDIDDLTIPPKEFLPQKMIEAIKVQKSEFEQLFKNDKRVSTYTPKFLFDKIDSSANYEYIWKASYLIGFHYKSMIKGLIIRITDQTKVGLINTDDLIIFERNEIGDLESYGHGYKVDDDLFTIAGRANYLLRSVTGEDFGYVSMYSTPSYLKRLQNRWIHWLWQLNKK